MRLLHNYNKASVWFFAVKIAVIKNFGLNYVIILYIEELKSLNSTLVLELFFYDQKNLIQFHKTLYYLSDLHFL